MSEPLNPPAFPHVFQDAIGSQRLDPGMTLRDYFAGQALAGMFARRDWRASEAGDIAYQYADAMLARRAKDKA